MEEKILEKIQARIMMGIPPGLTEVNIVSDMIIDEVHEFLKCDYKVLGERVFTDFKVPQTAWDHFKQDYMPKWFTNLFPVKLETNKMIICRLYPELEPKLPNETDTLHIERDYDS